jgi:hypothetical protein
MFHVILRNIAGVRNSQNINCDAPMFLSCVSMTGKLKYRNICIEIFDKIIKELHKLKLI